MSFIAEETTTYTPLSSGEYLARCISVIDLGSQISPYNPTTPKPRVALEFEIADEYLDNGEPRKLLIEFTRTTHKQGALRPFLEAWIGSLPTDQKGSPAFDVSKLLGTPARLIVTQQPKQNGGGMKNVIQTALPLAKGQKAPKAISRLVLFDSDSPDAAVFQTLPKFLQEKIMKAVKPKEVTTGNQGVPLPDSPDFNDSINF